MSSGNPDRTVGLLPATGPNSAKANFFREVASAFEFLALFYALSAEDQQALMDTVHGFVATAYKQKVRSK